MVGIFIFIVGNKITMNIAPPPPTRPPPQYFGNTEVRNRELMHGDKNIDR